MICTLMEKHGVSIFFKGGTWKQTFTIIILENNMQVLELVYDSTKDKFIATTSCIMVTR